MPVAQRPTQRRRRQRRPPRPRAGRRRRCTSRRPAPSSRSARCRGQERLLHRREGTGLLAVRAQGPENGPEQTSSQGSPAAREARPPKAMSGRGRRHHPSGPEPCGDGRQEHGEERVLDHGRGEDGADRGRAQAAQVQVEDQDDGQPAEGERAHRAPDHDQPALLGERDTRAAIPGQRHGSRSCGRLRHPHHRKVYCAFTSSSFESRRQRSSISRRLWL